MRTLLVSFIKEESGATMVEYAVLVALIAVAVIVTVGLLGTQINTLFERIRQCLIDPNSAACTGAGG